MSNLKITFFEEHNASSNPHKTHYRITGNSGSPADVNQALKGFQQNVAGAHIIAVESENNETVASPAIAGKVLRFDFPPSLSSNLFQES